MARNESATESHELDPLHAQTHPVATIGNTAQPENPKPIAAKESGNVKRPGDRIFEILSTASAAIITVMIAAIATLGTGGSPEFRCPDDERFIEQAALFEVFE